MALTIHNILAKWLKKAKLRNGSHSVVMSSDSTFYYRGFLFGFAKEDRILLRWPASLDPKKGPWGPEQEILLADPDCFKKLHKAFRNAMTDVTKVAIEFDRKRKYPAIK